VGGWAGGRVGGWAGGRATHFVHSIFLRCCPVALLAQAGHLCWRCACPSPPQLNFDASSLCCRRGATPMPTHSTLRRLTWERGSHARCAVHAVLRVLL
jgi:hypothetical protein